MEISVETLTPYQTDCLNGLICPYCKSKTKICTETEVYGREYKGRKIIACINFPNCDSYVGTHDNETPLGRLANKSLRNLKKKAHVYFDKIWREKLKQRDQLYEDLADFLEIPDALCHIGMFGPETCVKVDNWSKKLYNNLKQK